MNAYITKLNGISNTMQAMQCMTAEIAHGMGIREMGIYRYNADAEGVENRQRRFDGMIAGIGSGDIVICQFPTGNGVEFERALVRHIKVYHGRIVIFIHDFDARVFENCHSMLQDTVKLYNEAEVLIVPSQGMKRFLLGKGIRAEMKFIVQEMWDCVTHLNSLDLVKLKRELHFAGDPGKFLFPNTWNYEVPLKVYSNQECRGNNVRRVGWRTPERLLLELSEGGFGLVWHGDEIGHQYLSMNNSRKLSTYLAAGIPVIVPNGISNQCVIEQNHLGMVVDTLDEAVEIVKNITEQEYQEYVSAVTQFTPLLRDGVFTKKCLVEALQMSIRKDMYVYSESNETYEMPDCIFEYVCLNESYEDNLALSWIFRGEAEGFLIYDEDSGKLVGEVFNGLEHYLLVKNYSKKARLIVKAYIRAVKGKMIIAKSNVVALSEKCPVKSEISLVIPAYNAEEFVARGIDSALAQSFAGLEIIIVNDGSTDQTQKVIDWYKERYPQVKSVYQLNAGQAVARNIGVEHANGDYIGYMDSDDMLRPDMIERLYDSIIKNDCDIAMTSAYQLTNEGYEEVSVYPVPEDISIPIDAFFEHYINYAYPVIWNKLYKRSLIKGHPIPPVTYEDSAWMPYILSYAENLCYINEHLYEYDRTIRNVTYIHTSWSESAEKQYADRRDYVMFFLNNGNPKKRELLKKLAMGYVLGFENAFSSPRFKELRKEIDQLWN